MLPTKPNTMTTIEKLTQELEMAKLTLKFAKNVEIVCNAFNRKDEFTFDRFGVTTNLFNDTFFSCGSLNLKLHSVKHFEEMFELKFDKKIENKDWKKTISAIKFVLKNVNANDEKLYFLWETLSNIANEKIK